MPESLWKVKIDDGKIISIDYQGVEHPVEISSLKTVKIRTTDEGPWSTDVWWYLEDDERNAIVPGGATGEQSLMEELGKIPGYDDKVVIRAMGSTSNAEFIVFKRILKKDKIENGNKP